MRLILSNPAGLWALLAIPVILIIHFLQERTRRVAVSTLFLLERVRPESIGGMRFERLRHSVPLWLQILAALLLTWLLTEPRWIREQSHQTLVVVLDSSVSMSAYKKETGDLLQSRLSPWIKTAAHTEWHLLESDTRKRPLYRGTELGDLLKAYQDWEPTLGDHRPDDALMTARGLVRGHGLVIYVTDRPIEIAADIAVLSAGEPLENVGFAGSEVKADPGTGMKWRVLIKNYGQASITREWTISEDTPEGAPATGGATQNVTLPPGQTVVITGELPPNVERATLRLTPDRFPWDDMMPLQMPKPREVQVDLQLGGKSGDLLRKMTRAMTAVKLGAPTAPQMADLTIAELGAQTHTDAILTHSELGPSDTQTLDTASTVAEGHPLVQNLGWMGLLTGPPPELALIPNDEPLLWKGDRILALLRHSVTADGQSKQQLILNWDLASSNAARHPAVLVLIQRFMEEIRKGLTHPWAANFECRQALQAPGKDLTLTHWRPSAKPTQAPYQGRLPEYPGYFELRSAVSKDAPALISGSLQFADTRESDFTAAAPLNTVDERRWESTMKQTDADPWSPVWLLLILGCLLGSWGWRQRGVRT